MCCYGVACVLILTYFFRIYMLHDVWDFLDTVFVSLLFQFNLLGATCFMSYLS